MNQNLWSVGPNLGAFKSSAGDSSDKQARVPQQAPGYTKESHLLSASSGRSHLMS
jgi:hypothetical protein